MNPKIKEKLEDAVVRIEKIKVVLNSPEINQDKKILCGLKKEYGELFSIVDQYQTWKRLNLQLEEAQKIKQDQDFFELATEEINQLTNEMSIITNTIVEMLSKDGDDVHIHNVILEIRAAVGGDEASLFAGSLLRMYMKYSEKKGWKFKVLSASENTIGGYKEVILRMSGNQIYSFLKFEAGAHRVQRIPSTESQGRIHTSVCTVVVMPESPIEQDHELPTSDLRIDTFRASGRGGQHVNTTDSAVRITHIPTGTTAECQAERSQYRNKEQALLVLKARLREKSLQERENELSKTRKKLIGSGDRSDKIRTYNFPQKRITDHRVNTTSYQLSDFMEGEIDFLIADLQKARKDQNLENFIATDKNGTTIASLISVAFQQLSEKLSLPKNIAIRESRELMQEVLQLSSTQLIARETETIEENLIQKYMILVDKRCCNPMAYVVKKTSFYGMMFKIDETTLIPRMETEVLVDIALDKLSQKSNLSVLDLGTGSGIIAITLAKKRPDIQVTALDISEKILQSAKKNAALHNISNIRFIESNWFSKLDKTLKFDLIVSNPPYIAQNDPCLKNEMIAKEPKTALDGGFDGLQSIKSIVSCAPSYMSPTADIIIEHAHDQAENCAEILKEFGFKNISCVKDMNGIDRISIATI